MRLSLSVNMTLRLGSPDVADQQPHWGWIKLNKRDVGNAWSGEVGIGDLEDECQHPVVAGHAEIAAY